MNVDIKLGDCFIFADPQKLLRQRHNILNHLQLLLFLPHQLIPLEVQDLVPVTHISKVVDSQSLKFFFDGLFAVGVGVFGVGVDWLVDVVAVVELALGGDGLQAFGEFGKDALEES